MSTDSAAAVPARSRPTAVMVLGVLGLLTFALIPIQINTIYDGLPAHPLFLHVPVILIPVAAIAALVLAVRPAVFERHGVWITAVTVVALAATNLTIGAGKALRTDLFGGVRGLAQVAAGEAALVARHEHAADILRLLMILFCATMIVSLALWRARDGATVTGIGFVDGPLARLRAAMPALWPARIALVVLALACLYFVFHTGDLGAKAVWQGRVGGTRLPALGFGGRGGLGGSLFPPGVHPPGAPKG
ncbi:MAG: hypothetical protein ACRDMJ_08375 [Solirubrobacteraceae bacterium]